MVAASASAQLAEGKSKFLGNIAKNSANDSQFSQYWNQITPENSGQWGGIEATRDVMDWTSLDDAYNYAKANGFPNFLEYALGRQPVSPDGSAASVVGNQTIEGDLYLTLSFQRPVGLPDVRYIVEVCDNPLGAWDQIPVTSEHVVSSQSGLEQMLVRDITPVSEGGRRFMRLRAERILP